MWTRCLRQFEADPRRTTSAVLLLGRIVPAGILVLLAATAPLWTPQREFPRVPLLSAFRSTPAELEWCALIGTLAASVLMVAAGPKRTPGRRATCVFLASLFVLVLTNQHRLQPWAYHLALLGLILAFLPANEAIAWSRLLVVSIYVYSALSKLDASFIEPGGGPILDGLFRWLHVDGDQVSLGARRLLASLLPTGELFLAAGLSLRRFRRTALFASIGVHGLLIAGLGPWGADQRPAVLLWNAFLIVQNWVLFGLAGNQSEQPGGRSEPANPTTTERFSGAGIRVAVVFVLLFPATMPFGWCDVWPAWAVYATGPERMRVYIDLADRDRLPEDFRRYVEAPRFRDDRCLVRIDRWSLDATRSPLYPQNRFRLGVTLGLAEMFGLDDRLHVELEGPANRWTGRRSRRSLTGRAAVIAELSRDWLNGLPRPAPVARTIG